MAHRQVNILRIRLIELNQQNQTNPYSKKMNTDYADLTDASPTIQHCRRHCANVKC